MSFLEDMTDSSVYVWQEPTDLQQADLCMSHVWISVRVPMMYGTTWLEFVAKQDPNRFRYVERLGIWQFDVSARQTLIYFFKAMGWEVKYGMPARFRQYYSEEIIVPTNKNIREAFEYLGLSFSSTWVLCDTISSGVLQCLSSEAELSQREEQRIMAARQELDIWFTI